MFEHLTFGVHHLGREIWPASRRTTALHARERASAGEQAALQDRLLRRSVLAACEVLPAYAQLKGRVPSSGIADFLRDNVPVRDRDALRSRRAEFYPRAGRPRWWSLVGKTSGSTATPLDLFRSVDSALWEHAFHRQHWHWAGFTRGEWQVVLRGDPVVPIGRTSPPFWVWDRVGRQLFVSTRHLNRTSAQHIAGAIQSAGAAQLRAYPSAAAELARLNTELGLGLRFRAVITGSEMLYAVQRERIEGSFAARVFDFYGSAERVAFAAECERQRLHVHPEYAWVEIVDAEGRPTSGEGFVAGTTLHNTTMPLLRYRLDDTARWSTEPCPCGRTYPVLEGLSGRISELLRDLDGRPVSPGIITFAFKGVAHIERAQVAQVRADLWEVRIVPAVGFGDADAQHLLRNLSTLVSSRLNLRVTRVDDIALQQSGKFKWVVQEWRLQ